MTNFEQGKGPPVDGERAFGYTCKVTIATRRPVPSVGSRVAIPNTPEPKYSLLNEGEAVMESEVWWEMYTFAKNNRLD